MQLRFNDLPPQVAVSGSFSPTCEFTANENSLEAIKNGKLKLAIQQIGNKVRIKGIKISMLCARGKIKILVGGDDTEFFFGEGSSGTYDIRTWRASKIVIGENTTSNGVKIFCDKSEFITGKDCMFSSDIYIQSADQHGLVDLTNGAIINDKYRRIILGDHVWLGRASTVIPDVTIGKGSVIGIGSLVSKDVSEMSIAAGVPARIVKTDVTWSRSSTQLDDLSRAYIQQRS